MNEFGYLKAGSKCWVWHGIECKTTEGVVEEVRLSSNERKDAAIIVEGNTYGFDPVNGMNLVYAYLRLIHGPLHIDFPPRPRRTITREAPMFALTEEGPLWSIPLPPGAKNIHCYYDVEEDL